MRKIAIGLGALALFGGSALAATAAISEEVPLVQRHRLERWGFGTAGMTGADAAYRSCDQSRLVSVNTRRTAGDWLTGVLTAGIYTPEHAIVKCSPR